jgi:hypothetical protein
MANKKISELNVNLTPTYADLLPIVNQNETKQISLNNIANAINLGFIVRPRPINQNVTLPEDSDILYFGPLQVGLNYNITIPITTNLTIQ